MCRYSLHAVVALCLCAVLLPPAHGRVIKAGRQSLIWPWCGGLGEHGGDWRHGDDCPVAAEQAAAHTDFPVYNGFGPRMDGS